MKHNKLNRIVAVVKNVAIASVIVGGCIFAGNSDYQDAVLTEMKNNGAYYELSEMHPEASEAELVDLYNEEKR